MKTIFKCTVLTLALSVSTASMASKAPCIYGQGSSAYPFDPGPGYATQQDYDTCINNCLSQSQCARDQCRQPCHNWTFGGG
jgi:hypothetical protein